jgi:putative effector of murein hydrolase LrgA (UPF0299 family)
MRKALIGNNAMKANLTLGSLSSVLQTGEWLTNTQQLIFIPIQVNAIQKYSIEMEEW